jgi:hypothetical protein
VKFCWGVEGVGGGEEREEGLEIYRVGGCAEEGEKWESGMSRERGHERKSR